MVENDAAAPPRGLAQIEDAAAVPEGHSGKMRPLSEGSRDEGVVEGATAVVEPS